MKMILREVPRLISIHMALTSVLLTCLSHARLVSVNNLQQLFQVIGPAGARPTPSLYSLRQTQPLHEVDFRACRDGSPAPLSVRVECDEYDGRGMDTCSVGRGVNHTISVDFVAQRSSSMVSSSISWMKWMEMPLLGQDSRACNYLQCPLHEGTLTSYVYNLVIPTYTKQIRRSLIWRLYDEFTKEVLLCFSFRTHVH